MDVTGIVVGIAAGVVVVFVAMVVVVVDVVVFAVVVEKVIVDCGGKVAEAVVSTWMVVSNDDVINWDVINGVDVSIS